MDVARAALLEVGLDPSPVVVEGRGLTIKQVDLLGPDRPMYSRAGYLAAASEYGANHPVRCADCSVNGTARGMPPCTTAGDALRGVRCGRSS